VEIINEIKDRPIKKEKVLIQKEKEKQVINFNVGKKKLNIDFYTDKFKTLYGAKLIENNENEIIFGGKDIDVILKKI
jgi:hypothetical protein